ncbi:YSIRK-type signal peptide-containing protein [Staphylococcus sp. IVB6181]|uniref:GA-like domain-containing protein n=1 Tax=Staphylococcus sp. IVB6181 TaxID=2929481 RepID=UPI0021D0CBE6|nr:YSIRK-type signal peptide-containing protein [Staphylococcus sp. IVB6181]UXV36277.1 YSIRK-type signal peptide-containing protein [Staphylococcus sp. IVB6181]
MKQQSKRRLDFLPNKQNKYSIRKFTVGTASILVGATFLFGLSHEAQAAEEQTPNDVTVQSQSVNTHSNNESASQPSQETSDTAAVTPPVTTEAPASETAAPTNPNATPTTSQESTSQQKAPTSETNEVSTQTTTASQTTPTSSESTPVVEQQPTSETIAKPRTRRALETADTFESIPAPVNNETYNGKIIDYSGDLVKKVENPGKTVAPDYINFSPKFTNYDSKSYSFLTNGTNVTSKKLTNTNDGAIHAYLGDYITLNNTSPEAYVYINNVGIADGHKVDALVHVTRDQASTNFPTDIRYFFTSGRDMLSMTSQDGGGTTANIKFLQNIEEARLDEFYNTIQNGTSISSVVDGLNALNSEAHPVSGLLNIYDLDDYDRNKAVDVRKSVTFNRNEINELYVSNQQPFPATANLELKDGKIIISTGEQPRGGVEEYPNRVTATFQDKSELTYSMTGRNASGTAFHVKGILLVPIQPYTTQVVNPVNGTDGKVTVTQYIPTREVSQPATLPSKVEISAEFPQGISATAQPNTSDFAASQNGTNKVILTSTTQALSKPSFYDHTYVLPITLKHELTVNDISSNSEKWLKLKEYYDGDVLNVPVKWSFDNGDKQWDNLTTDHSTVPLKLSDELKREIDKQIMAEATASVEEAKIAHAQAKEKAQAIVSDQLVNSNEATELQTSIQSATDKKSIAQEKVNQLPERLKIQLQAELDQLTPIAVPDINDKNNNNISDEQDELIAQAEALIADASKAEETAKSALNQLNADNAISPEDNTQLTQLQNDFTEKKQAAKDKIASIQQPHQGPLTEKLNKLLGIHVPEVNDRDGNGKPDDLDAQEQKNTDLLNAAADLVAKAEEADKTAQTKLQSAVDNNLITPEESTDLISAKDNAAATKAKAEEAVHALPQDMQNSLLDRLNKLHGIEVPSINDKNKNDIPDTQDELIEAAKLSIKEVQDADATAKSELATAQADQLINPTEHSNLDRLQNGFTTKKQSATDKVNAIDPKYRKDLPEQLQALTGITVPEVNDANSNGKPDSEEQQEQQDVALQAATDLVEKAEAADRAAQEQLLSANDNNLITPEEHTSLTAAKDSALTTKTAAEAVKALPQNVQESLLERLNKLHGIEVPSINDKNSNGIPDDQDALINEATKAYEYAKAGEDIVKTELAKAQADSVINPEEHTMVGALQDAFGQKKAEAESKVNAIDEKYRGELPEKVAALIGVTVPEVNDANSNAKLDSQEQQEQKAQQEAALQAATDLVEKAEAADRAAQEQLQSANDNKLITPEEHTSLTTAKDSAATTKSAADEAVKALPQDVQESLLERLNKLHGIEVPSINDKNSNGIPDNQDELIKAAELSIKEAQNADALAKSELATAQADQVINPTEHNNLDELQNDFTTKKQAATDKVNAIDEKYRRDLPEQLQALTGITVPKVNDANNNGQSDDAEQAALDTLLADAKAALEKAKAADQAAKAQLSETEQDQVINPVEHEGLEAAKTTAATTKSEAADKINALPETLRAPLQAELDQLNGITIPSINDKNTNQIPDDQDALIEAAKAAIQAAEAADAFAKAALNKADENQAITPEEHQQLSGLQADFVQKKAAEQAVNAINEAFRGVLPGKLAALTGIDVPEVNDADSNGKLDAAEAQELQDALQAATELVEKAEAADRAAQEQLQSANTNDLITPEEHTSLTAAKDNAATTKSAADEAVKALPEAVEGPLLERLNQLHNIQVPSINDENNNNIPDNQDELIKEAEVSLKEVQEADASANSELTKAQADQVINSTEHDNLDGLQNNFTTKKQEAEEKVNAIDERYRGGLPQQLAALNGINVPSVNDENSNGIEDSIDSLLADAQKSIDAAKEMAGQAQDKLNEAKADQLINPKELEALTGIKNLAEANKQAAQAKINNLPQQYQAPLQAQLDQINTIALPEVNDKDANQIDDHTDELKAAVQALVDEAKAANQAAHQEKSDIEKDNLVTPLEQAQLKDKARYAAEAKQLAQRAVDMISETLRPEFQTQLDALIPVEMTNINDQNSNGINDVQDRLIEDAQKAIKAAQDAEAAAQIGLNAALDNEVITDSEQNILDALQKDFAAKKAIAQEKVGLVEDALKGDMPRTLEQLHGITVPEVNDKNHNDVDDALDAALQALIQKAEDANQDAHKHLAEANTDSLITPKEYEALVSDQTKADTTKEEAVAAVKESHIPETVKAELLEVLAQLDNIDVPKINDANNNKIADDVDAQLAEAEELVKKAEALNEAAQNELAKAEADQLITPSEHQALTQQQVLFEGAKAAAEQWVAQLPKGYQSQFEARLNPLHGINIPDINDQNSNNIKDSDDAARAEAEEFVKVAQLMDTKLQEKLKALTSDALINPEEYAQLAQLNAIYEDVKEQAAAKVSQLPATLKGDLPSILASLKGIALPQVNDKNNNDIDDATDQNINEANVALEAAKAADKAAKAAFNEAVSDNLVTPEEQATLKAQQANAQTTKAIAQSKVEPLPTELKGSLEEELAQLTGIDVLEINDANANGTNDIQDQWLNDAIEAVNTAKVADQTAKAHYNEAVTDNLVTPEEQATLKEQQANAQNTKAIAQSKVDSLPTELKGSLEDELAQLTGIVVPNVSEHHVSEASSEVSSEVNHDAASVNTDEVLNTDNHHTPSETSEVHNQSENTHVNQSSKDTDTNEETVTKELVQVETGNNEAAAVHEQVKTEQSTQLNLDKNI